MLRIFDAVIGGAVGESGRPEVTLLECLEVPATALGTLAVRGLGHSAALMLQSLGVGKFRSLWAGQPRLW